MKSNDIVWWTTRVRGRQSKQWTTFPVRFIRAGDFIHVLGLIGKWRGMEFSVVRSEITTYPPLDKNTKLALGAKKYLSEYESQKYSKQHKITKLPGTSTLNDASKSYTTYIEGIKATVTYYPKSQLWGVTLYAKYGKGTLSGSSGKTSEEAERKTRNLIKKSRALN